GAKLVELGDALLERATGKRDPEDRLLVGDAALSRLCGGVRMRPFFRQSLRARILSLFVTPDAVMRLVEATDEVGAAIGERETFAVTHSLGVRPLQRRYTILRDRFDRHEVQHVELARRAEEHAAAMRGPAFVRVRRPRGVALCGVERDGVGGFVLLPLDDRARERQLERRDVAMSAEQRIERVAQLRA